jgi:pimeloyl-ACP methyl ester carboxylesterase
MSRKRNLFSGIVSCSKIVQHELGATLEEVRPERTLFVRRIFVGDLDQNVAYNLVFVHVICGSEIQFQCLMEQMDQLLSRIHIKLYCLLFDSVGCGRSPIIEEWRAYQKNEIVSDLHAVMQKYLCDSTPIILIGHSYGPSVFLSMISNDKSSEQDSVSNNLAGCIFLGSSLRFHENPQKDYGHPIMGIPLPLLKLMQRSLTKAFVEIAVHKVQEELKKKINQESNKNNMFMAKAYHRQAVWATEKELTSVQKLPALVVHGADDGVIPLECAKKLVALLPLSELVVINNASHLVMIEKAAEVSTAILRFIQKLTLPQ